MFWNKTLICSSFKKHIQKKIIEQPEPWHKCRRCPARPARRAPPPKPPRPPSWSPFFPLSGDSPSTCDIPRTAGRGRQSPAPSWRPSGPTLRRGGTCWCCSWSATRECCAEPWGTFSAWSARSGPRDSARAPGRRWSPFLPTQPTPHPHRAAGRTVGRGSGAGSWSAKPRIWCCAGRLRACAASRTRCPRRRLCRARSPISQILFRVGGFYRPRIERSLGSFERHWQSSGRCQWACREPRQRRKCTLSALATDGSLNEIMIVQ